MPVRDLRYFEESGNRVPVMISGTFDKGGATFVSGQEVEAFSNAIAHFPALSVGMNCALGPELMRPHLETLQQVSSHWISCHPNAGLPNEMGHYDLGPAAMAGMIAEFAERGWVNIVGGCCGTTPEHIAAMAAAVRGMKPHKRVTPEPYMRLSGTRPLTLRPDSNFLMIGERTNVTGSRKFARLVKDEKYEEAVEIARSQVDGGANIIDINMDEALLDGEAVMTKYLRLIAGEHDVAAVPVMVDSSKWSVIEAGLKCDARQADRQLDQPQGRRSRVPAPREAMPLVRHRRRRHGVRRARARPSTSTTKSASASGPTSCSPRKSASRPKTSFSTRTSSPSPRASRSTTTTPSTSSNRFRKSKPPARACTSRAA